MAYLKEQKYLDSSCFAERIERSQQVISVLLEWTKWREKQSLMQVSRLQGIRHQIAHTKNVSSCQNRGKDAE